MKIKYIFWDDDTGYGIAARQLMKSLLDNGIQIIPVAMKQNQKHPIEYFVQDRMDDSYKYDIVFIHTTPYYIRRYIEPGKLNMVYCTWETTFLPQKWVKELNASNVIFVSSQFNKKCFEQSGVNKPIHVLPHISQFNDGTIVSSNVETNKTDFTFYSIGMWTNRKNNLALMNAFTNAFPNGEAVQLIIKTSKKDYSKPAFDLFKRWGYTYYYDLDRVRKIRSALKKDPRIKIITEKWTADKIAELHYTNDCYISLCKSEGWGLGAYEAAWFGKPIIITGFGGQLDFLPDPLATLLPYKLIKIKDPVWTDYNEEGQEWAEVKIEAAIQAMKEVFSNQQKYIQQGKQLKEYVSSCLSANQIIKIFIHQLQTYLGRE